MNKRQPLATFKKHPKDRVKFEIHARGVGFEIVRCGGCRVIVGFGSTLAQASERAEVLVAQD